MNHFVPFDFVHEAIHLRQWLRARGYDSVLAFDPQQPSINYLKVFYEDGQNTSALYFSDCRCISCTQYHGASFSFGSYR